MSYNNKYNILPRLLRHRDAPRYLGMDRNRFNKEVRPFVTEMRIGSQGIAFDRLDLDKWVDEYKEKNGVTRENNKIKAYHAGSHTKTERYSEEDFKNILKQIKETSKARKKEFAHK